LVQGTVTGPANPKIDCPAVGIISEAGVCLLEDGISINIPPLGLPTVIKNPPDVAQVCTIIIRPPKAVGPIAWAVWKLFVKRKIAIIDKNDKNIFFPFIDLIIPK